MTRTFLKEHFKKIKEREQLEFEREQLNVILKSPALSGASSGNSPYKDKVGEIVANLNEKDARILGVLGIILDEEPEIEKYIKKLPDSRHRTILRYRYISGLEWELICVKVGYCWQHVHKIHKNALEKIEDITCD